MTDNLGGLNAVETPNVTKAGDTANQCEAAARRNQSSRAHQGRPASRQRVRRWAAASLAICLPLTVAACGNDDDPDVGAAVTEAISDVSSAVTDGIGTVDSALDNAGTAVDDAADGSSDTSADDEGQARDYAMQMMSTLQALPDGGEPTVANMQQAAQAIPQAEVSGLEDEDGNGRDDDAKMTVEAGDDKACLQHQEGAWEVTDDEC